VRITRTLAAVGACGALVLGAAACGSSSNSGTSTASGSGGSSSGSGGTVNGAGSTLAAPVYMQWGSELKGKGVTVNYQAVGSGAGVAQWLSGTANFAGTDPPLKPAEMTQAKGKKGGQPVQIPTVFGAITVSYNVPGLKAGVKLDGATIADVFLGKVKKWNDAAIAKLNPGLKLPSSAITVIHRSDESGTTKGFTTFLSDYSSQWKSKVGADKTVKWPTGTGAKGNDGVAAAIKQQQGAIGYVEQAYALQNNFTFADIKNAAGKFVAPTLASTSAAGEGLKVPKDLTLTAINAPNPAAYPIVSQTFVVVHRDLCQAGLSQSGAKAMVRFLNFGLGQGQGVAKKLSYAPLPASLLAKSRAQVTSLQCNRSPIGS
jgi:phosphate transport system substrate-binding protein